ncbi:MAG: tetratricopeptide repeat protein [Bacteroidaceae bacterium]|nr:tetratricopeptide repeat protein [Bacteroidaceae bacterium]
MQDITYYIEHPEQLDKETLFKLRQIVAQYPYFHTARILMLQNLFILHDPTFNEELAKSAPLLPDRTILFDLVEGNRHFIPQPTTVRPRKAYPSKKQSRSERTISLIDDFLTIQQPEERSRKKFTPIDATTDYAAYLEQLDDYSEDEGNATKESSREDELLSEYIEHAPQRTGLLQKQQEEPLEIPEDPHEEDLPDDEELPVEKIQPESEEEEGFLTETLAKIYVQQGRYGKALEIIRRLSADYQKKNSYFADQIRFLEKIIYNEQYKNKKNT